MNMHKMGLVKKLALTLGVYALLSILSIAVLNGMLQKLNSGLTNILEVGKPRDAAIYKMKGASDDIERVVDRYLRQPQPDNRKLLESTIADFELNLAAYQKLERSEVQLAVSRNMNEIFFNYSQVGRDLMDLKTLYEVRREMFIDALKALEEMTRQLPHPTGPQASGAISIELEQIKLLSQLQAKSADVVARLNRLREKPEDTAEKFEQEIEGINRLISEYSKIWPQGTGKIRLNLIAQQIEWASVMAHRIVEQRSRLDEVFLTFVDDKDRLNGLLIDQLQLQASVTQNIIYEDLKHEIAKGHRLLILWAPVMLGLVGSFLVLISRMVVRPVRLLTRAADSFGEGEYTYRVPEMQQDELGRLSGAFNIMAERLQTAYASLKQTNAELDARVKERTNALAEANDNLHSELELRQRTEIELREAILTANAASQAKNLFVGNVSHELRTPLNAIIGFSEIIKAEMFGPVQNQQYLDYAKDIYHSGAHLLKLINELLDISRIEAGEMKLSEAAFDLAGCAEESVHLLERSAEARGVTLSCEIADGLPSLYGDETRVKQIFINLAGNAIKFTPPGGAVTVSVEKSPNGGLQLKVTDTGIGIAPEDIKKVLEPFGQISNDLTRAHEGAGLGLPLARLLAERHQGHLTITSEPGRGTCITVSFPAQRCIDDPPQQTRQAAS